MKCGLPFVTQPNGEPPVWLSVIQMELRLYAERETAGHNSTGICPSCRKIDELHVRVKEVEDRQVGLMKRLERLEKR